jgi:hypothetical protein
MKTYTKQSLIEKLQEVANQGWISSARAGNQGGVGNTLEDLLGIAENNLPIPNAAEWELKTQRTGTTSLITLFHSEPSPQALKFVPLILLPFYGWPHTQAGTLYPATEMSFRQTINGAAPTDRGFSVKVDRTQRKVIISFDVTKVSNRHEEWLQGVRQKVGPGELTPQPYWGFDDLQHKAGTKLHNCFYVQADVKRVAGIEYFWFNKVMMLQKFNFEGFLKAIEDGYVLVDFDARTGHNHGTKFRLRQNYLPLLYNEVTTVIAPVQQMQIEAEKELV